MICDEGGSVPNLCRLQVFLVLFLAGLIFQPVLFADSDADSDQNTSNRSSSGETAERSVKELVNELSSDERPPRQDAASKLVVRKSKKAVHKVSELLYSGSDREKSALLTAIANEVGSENSVTHLLKPILLTYARHVNGSDTTLVEAVSYYPEDTLLQSLESLLTGYTTDTRKTFKMTLLQKARLVRVLSRNQIQADPIAAARLLVPLLDTLSPELKSEILVVLQERFHLYLKTRFEDWKLWWNEQKTKKDAEIYRSLLRQRSDAAFQDWKGAVDHLLAVTGDKSSSPSVDKLLQTKDPRKIVYLLQQIQEHPDRENLIPEGEKVLMLLSDQSHPAVRREVIKAIGVLNINEGRDEVTKLIDHYRPSIREAVAVTLGKIGNGTSGERLAEQLRNEKNRSVMIAILSALKKLDYKEAVFILHDQLQKTNLHASVRNEIVSTLGSMGQAKSLPILKSLLRKSEPEEQVTLRFNLALSIGEIGVLEGVSPLIELLESPTPSVRGAAALALGNISFEGQAKGGLENKKALRALFQLLQQAEDPTVKRRAAKSISKISIPRTADQLAEVIVAGEGEIEDVIRDALSNILEKYPEKLTSVIPVLQDDGHHSLVVEIAGQLEKETLNSLDKSTYRSVTVGFVKSYLAVSNWSKAMALLERMEFQDQKPAHVAYLEAKTYIGLGNVSEAGKVLTDLEDQTEKGTRGWWRVQHLKARLLYRQGTPEKALTFINETLRPQSPPDDINEKLKRIEEKHKTVLKIIDQGVSDLLSGSANGETGEDEGNGENSESGSETQFEALLEMGRYHRSIVRRGLNRLPDDPQKIKEQLTPRFSQVMNDITGCDISFSGNEDVETVQKMRDQWENWLNRDQSSSDDSSPSS